MINQTILTSSNQTDGGLQMKFVFFKSIVVSVLTASVLLLSACGGGGSSSSTGGGSNFSGGSTVVKGNISTFAGAQATNNEPLSDAQQIVEKIWNTIIPLAKAETVVEGIEVCIAERCGLTDAQGNFQVNLDGFASGIYVISFSHDGKIYKSDIEVIANAIVTLQGITISADGVVRVSNIKVDVTVEEPTVQNVLICHKTDLGQETLEIPLEQLGGHLEHGDHKGECGSVGEEPEFAICHLPETGDQKTLFVTEPEYIAEHKVHGDIIGECKPFGEHEFPICHLPETGDQKTLFVTEPEYIAEHKVHGDIIGECKPFGEHEFPICHLPETGDQETLFVTEPEYKEDHKEHGDTIGECKNLVD